MSRTNPFRFTRTTAPTAAAVTTAEMKIFAEYQETDRNDLLDTMVAAATSRVEAYSGRQMITATFTALADDFPGTTGVIQLKKPPFQSVTSIKYYDVDGAQQTLDSGKYILDASKMSGRIFVKTWDSETWPATEDRNDAVEVIFKAGYGDASTDVEDDDRTAIMMQALIWFNREAPVGGLDRRVKALLWQRRVA